MGRLDLNKNGVSFNRLLKQSHMSNSLSKRKESPKSELSLCKHTLL